MLILIVCKKAVAQYVIYLDSIRKIQVFFRTG